MPVIPRLGECQPAVVATVAEAMLRINKLVLCTKALRICFNGTNTTHVPFTGPIVSNPDAVLVLMKVVRRVFGLDASPPADAPEAVTNVIKSVLLQLMGAKDGVDAGDKVAVEIALETFLINYIETVTAQGRAWSFPNCLAASKCVVLVRGTGSTSDIARLVITPKIFESYCCSIGLTVETHKFLKAQKTEEFDSLAATFYDMSKTHYPQSVEFGGSSGPVVRPGEDPETLDEE